MENASKALLMAGGILLVMLIVSLVIFAWGRFSDYYNNEDELQDVEDVAKFNLQFTNYDRKDVHGYELISLANKVADYNFRHSSASGAKNDEKYTPITMNISFPNNTAEQLWYDTTDRSHFFNKGATITQSSTRNDILNIQNGAKKIEDFVGSADETVKVIKSLKSFSDDQITYYMNSRNLTQKQAEKIVLDDYKSIVKASTVATIAEMRNEMKTIANFYEYYEYYQFKKGKFNCTGIEYDNVSNRVKTISFKFTGNIE